MTTQNKQNSKNPKGMAVTTNKQKERPGAAPEHPSNADYDYRPDFGTSGGAVEHNPELDKDTVQNPPPKKLENPIEKPKSTGG